MSIACLQSEIDWRKVAATIEKLNQQLHFCLHGTGALWGAYFCMGAYKCNVVVVIKMGAYNHGVLILCGCLLSQFYGTLAIGNCN